MVRALRISVGTEREDEEEEDEEEEEAGGRQATVPISSLQ
jgi:hypothetical protein